MKPTSITIAGFGPYHDPVKLKLDDGVLCVTGDNGSGKTFIVEAVFAALYGRFPSRDGALVNHVSEGRVEDSVVDLRFAHGGESYKVTRTIKPSGKASAMLKRDDETLAGPKVRDVDSAVTALVGPQHIAEATWFSSRGRKGDLCNVQPKERRDVLGHVLDLGTLTKLADTYGAQANADEAVVQKLAAQLSAPSDAPSVESCEAELKGLEAGLEQAKTAREEVSADLSAKIGRRDKLKADIDSLGGIRQKLKEAERVERESTQQLTEAQQSLDDARTSLAGINEAAEAVTNATVAAEHAAELEQWKKEADDLAAWHRREGELREAVETRKDRVAEIEDQIQLDDETMRLADGLDAAEKALEAIQRKNAEIKTSNDARVQRSAVINADINSLRRQITTNQKRKESKPETPADDAVCATCPLMGEWEGIDGAIDDLNEQLAEMQAKLDALPESELAIDETKARDAVQAAKAAKAEVAKMRHYADLLDKARESLDAAKKRLAEHAKAKPKDVELWAPEQQAELDTAKEVASELVDRRVHLEKLRAIDASMQSLENDVDAKRRTSLAATKERERIQAEADEVADTIEQVEAEIAKLAGDIEANRKRLTEFDTTVSELSRKCGQAEGRLEEARRIEARDKAKREELHEAELTAKAKRLLQRAFGQKGVQQLLIDDAIPELEHLADQLLERMSGGTQRLRIHTQAENKDGSTREDTRIVVVDAFGERDISTFSGGELQVVQCILRIAMARWIAQLHGHSPECLLIDEAFSDLDDENEAKLVDLVNSLPEWVGQVVVVTPKPSVASRFERRVTVSKNFAGVKVGVA